MKNKQIEKRVELLNYFINNSTSNVLDNRYAYTLSIILLKQLQVLIEKEIGNFLIYDVNFCDNKDEEAVSKLKDLAKELGVIPIDTENVNSDKILVVDINYLPSGYKNMFLDELEMFLEDKYETKVLLIDTSRANVQGGHNEKPVYYI